MSRVAVITGISSGIGQAIKARLEQDGWQTYGVSRHLPVDQEGYEADLSIIHDLEPLATRIASDLERVDAFIHVAGVWHDGHDVFAGKKLNEFSGQQIASTVSVGLIAAMVISAKLIPVMQPESPMIYISGTFQDGGANWLPYYTSKRALEDFVQGLAQEQDGLRVYAVSPGDTATESLKKYYPEAHQSAQSPDRVAEVCLDLVNSKLSADSGAVVRVKDGSIGLGYHS